MTLNSLIRDYNISSNQLNLEIEEQHVVYLAAQFDNMNLYPRVLGLTISEQVDVEAKAHRDGNQIAMAECLSLWRRHNPAGATLRTLLNTLLELRKEEVAVRICGFYFKGSSSGLSGQVFSIIYFVICS